MKKKACLGWMTLMGLMLSSSAVAGAHSHDGLPHLDLEMTGEEYRAIQEGRNPEVSPTLRRERHVLDAVIELGKRNLDWLKHINSHRPEGKKVSFTSKTTQTGIPITAPFRNNSELVLTRTAEAKAALPAAIRSVLLDGAALTDDVPVSEEDYITHGRAIDRMYQHASRWLLQEPFLYAYSARRAGDIRGYHFLSRETDLLSKLTDWSQLPIEERQRLSGLLISLCFNTQKNETQCSRQLQEANDKAAFYSGYVEQGRQVYEAYFTLQNPRSEAVWTAASSSVFVMPFSDPGTDEVRAFLKDNIEDEWRLGEWKLEMNFLAPSSSLARIVFRPGVTPNVNGLGGNTITMDANAPLTEYGVQWTIRHEFGHVLGLPDCYVEFYDQDAGEMINYQIDVDNLMCSRKGRILQTHYDELKRRYFKR